MTGCFSTNMALKRIKSSRRTWLICTSKTKHRAGKNGAIGDPNPPARLSTPKERTEGSGPI